MSIPSSLAQRKKYLLFPVLLLLLVPVLKKTILAPPQVRGAVARKHDLTAQVYGNGTVEAKVVVGVSSKITGRIVELYADQGDLVCRGQLLARLENDDLLQQQHQSEAGVGRFAAALAVEQANLRKANANLALAEKNAVRYRNLVEKNLVSRLEAEQHETAWQVAREEAARSQAAIEAAKMEQRAGHAGLGFARSKVADTLIYAPQDGVIIARHLERGATLSPGAPIFSLADPQVVWVKANVDESQLKGIEVGKEALITLRSAPGESLPGRVARLGRQSDRVTEELEVDVAFAAPLKEFRLGEQSDVHIVTGKKTGALAVPSAAIVRGDDRPGVWIEADGRISFRPVSTGILDPGNLTEITEGVKEGERVVWGTPAQMATFQPGKKVRVAK